LCFHAYFRDGENCPCLPDSDEVDLVFERSRNYAKGLEKVRIDLNWMEPSYVVELEGRHNAGFGMHVYWNLEDNAYKL
jgi:hypothetical protein